MKSLLIALSGLLLASCGSIPDTAEKPLPITIATIPPELMEPPVTLKCSVERRTASIDTKQASLLDMNIAILDDLYNPLQKCIPIQN